MGVLSDVLAYKRQKDADEMKDILAIPTALQTFTEARKQANDTMMQQLALNVTAAGHGLKIGPDGSIVRDESLKTDLEKLIERSKVAEAAKLMGNRQLYEDVTGTSSVGNQADPLLDTTPAKPEEAGPLSGIEAPEIDLFTGKPTSKGLQQEAKNKLIQQEQEQSLKKKVPGAQQQADLIEAKNAKSLLTQMKDDAKKLPSGYGAIWQNIVNFFTRGETNAELVTYNDSRPAAAVGLYRTLTGDKRLSDNDAKSRALPLLWDSDEGGKVREKKFKKLMRMASAREKLVAAGQYTVDENGQFITPLSEVEKEAENFDDDASSERFTPAVERDIQDSMKYYNKTRREVIEAMREQDLLD